MLPQLSIQVDGQGAVSAGDYNSKTYWAVDWFAGWQIA